MTEEQQQLIISEVEQGLLWLIDVVVLLFSDSSEELLDIPPNDIYLINFFFINLESFV